MIRLMAHIPAIVLSALVLNSCNYRDINNAYFSSCDILLNVDWSGFTEEEVSGMSVWCYPIDNSGNTAGKPYTYLTNNTASCTVSLPKGRYNILVFNQSVDEFGSFRFSGMERYETAEIVLEDRMPDWTPVTEGQSISLEPEWFAVDRYPGLDVTSDMVRKSKEIRDTGSQYGIVQSISLRPLNVVYAASVDIRIHGINNLYSARGSLTGLSKRFLLGEGGCGEEKTTNLLESWSLIKDKGDEKKGHLKIGFRTLGLPGSKPEITKAGGGRDPQANLLAISALLVDQETICKSTFAVGDRISTMPGSLKFNLELGFDSESPQEPGEDANPLKPILLPDVKPKGGGGGGFSAEVEDWGEEVDVDVPVF